ncbi:class I SAM-dependent methyltransferase [Spongiibacter sp.]|uniref:class I SAM-dependent methyltransferase n=1 Tax=Spongiibacter sp. TaxID=2024860 RepID=UPI00356B0F4F
MSLAKWQQKYATASLPQPACWLLREYQSRLPQQGLALDVACGLGGNAVLLAEAGLQVDAVDYASTALHKLADYAAQRQLPIRCQQRDLEADGLPPDAAGRYAVIVVSYYLHRPLLCTLGAALQPGGLLFYQTFNTRRRHQRGPSNAHFLLTAGELAEQFAGFDILLNREDLDLQGEEYALQSAFIARKPSSAITR